MAQPRIAQARRHRRPISRASAAVTSTAHPSDEDDGSVGVNRRIAPRSAIWSLEPCRPMTSAHEVAATSKLHGSWSTAATTTAPTVTPSRRTTPRTWPTTRPPTAMASAIPATSATVAGTMVAATAVRTPRMKVRWTTERSDVPGPASPPMIPNGARREARASWFTIHGASP